MLLCCFPACTYPKPEVIKIGLVAPFEGDKRYLGYDAIYAARLAIREINSAGGINGIPVELVAYDDRASTDMATDAVRNLVIDQQVVAVVGHYYDVAPSVTAIYNQYQLPILMINAPVTVEGLQSDYRFYVAPTKDTVQQTIEDFDIQDPLVDYAEWGASISDTNSSQGMCTLTPYPYPHDVPETEAWISENLDVGPHVPAPGVMALVTYDTIKALAQTLAEHSAYDRESALTAIADLDYTGYLGHIKWAENTQTWAGAPLYYYCWRDGQWMLQRQLTVGE